MLRRTKIEAMQSEIFEEAKSKIVEHYCDFESLISEKDYLYQGPQRTFTPLGLTLKAAFMQKERFRLSALLRALLVRKDPANGILMHTASTIKGMGIRHSGP